MSESHAQLIHINGGVIAIDLQFQSDAWYGTAIMCRKDVDSTHIDRLIEIKLHRELGKTQFDWKKVFEIMEKC